MSDPNNQYPAFDQSPYGQASYGQASYGQAPQGAYGQAYMLNPALEKIRSNASNVRLFSFLSFVLGGIFLSGGMWFWANSMMSEAQSLGAPLDITTDLASARNTAKICSIIHIVLIVAVVAFYAIAIISVIAAGGSRY